MKLNKNTTGISRTLVLLKMNGRRFWKISAVLILIATLNTMPFGTESLETFSSNYHDLMSKGQFKTSLVSVSHSYFTGNLER